jgi:hypothetical protein
VGQFEHHDPQDREEQSSCDSHDEPDDGQKRLSVQGQDPAQDRGGENQSEQSVVVRGLYSSRAYFDRFVKNNQAIQ